MRCELQLDSEILVGGDPVQRELEENAERGARSLRQQR